MLSSRDTAAASMDLKRTDIPEKWIAGLASPPPVLNPIRDTAPTPFPSSVLGPELGRQRRRGGVRKKKEVGSEGKWCGLAEERGARG